MNNTTTTAEAKEMIKAEFIKRFYEWLDDEKNLDPKEYGWKYGYQKSEVIHTENLKSVMTFQKYMFSGRYLPAWEKEGYDRKIIWALHREGFLSLAEHNDWMSRQTGRTSFYFISQKTAKEIYKESKAR